MANPWEAKGRTYWKNDDKYNKFSEKLYNEFWTFEKTVKFTNVQNDLKLTNKQWKNTKEIWLEYVEKWNKMEQIPYKNQTKGFVAIAYLYAFIPYENIYDVDKYLTEFEASNINTIYFYNMNGDYIQFKNYEELIFGGPIYPSEYKKWLDDKYNRASWWITYMVYEKINGLKPIIDSPPVQIC